MRPGRTSNERDSCVQQIGQQEHKDEGDDERGEVNAVTIGMLER